MSITYSTSMVQVFSYWNVSPWNSLNNIIAINFINFHISHLIIISTIFNIIVFPFLKKWFMFRIYHRFKSGIFHIKIMIIILILSITILISFIKKSTNLMNNTLLLIINIRFINNLFLSGIKSYFLNIWVGKIGFITGLSRYVNGIQKGSFSWLIFILFEINFMNISLRPFYFHFGNFLIQ